MRFEYELPASDECVPFDTNLHFFFVDVSVQYGVKVATVAQIGLAVSGFNKLVEYNCDSTSCSVFRLP